MEYSIYYDEVKSCDRLRGPGLRVTLLISGCKLHKFTDHTLEEVVSELSNEYYAGISFDGDDPLNNENRESIKDIVRTLKAVFGDSRSICLYTDYQIEDIVGLNDPVVNELMDYVDTVIERKLNKRTYLVHHNKDGDSFHLVNNEVSLER